MATTWRDLPEDHPIFGGTHFVFRSDPPESAEDEVAPQADDDVEGEGE